MRTFCNFSTCKALAHLVEFDNFIDMKKMMFVAVCIICAFTTKAQVPNFAFDSARWVVYGTLPYETRTVYTTGADTVIGTKTYTTIWTDFYDNSFADTNNLELFIRPDSSNRVWFRYPSTISSDTNEYVLYDFLLQVGDTFITNGGLVLPPETLIVNFQFNSQLYDNSTVATTEFSQPSQGCHQTRFVETIGMVDHPFYPLLGTSTFPDTCLPFVACFQVNGILLYGNAQSCDVLLNVEQENHIDCSPELIESSNNMATFLLPCGVDSDLEVTVYNSLGQVIYTGHGESNTFSVPRLCNSPTIITFQSARHFSSFLLANPL